MTGFGLHQPARGNSFFPNFALSGLYSRSELDTVPGRSGVLLNSTYDRLLTFAAQKASNAATARTRHLRTANSPLDPTYSAKTVWYSWVAPFTSRASFMTFPPVLGESVSVFTGPTVVAGGLAPNPILAVYTGTPSNFGRLTAGSIF